MSIDAMKQALEALEGNCTNPAADPEQAAKEDAAITALRAAIEQTQEPVAWMYTCDGDTGLPVSVHTQKDSAKAFWWKEIPLYTAPRQWQGLTDEEIKAMMDYWSDDARSAYGGAHVANGEYVYIPDIIRDAEARLKEKNT